MAILSKTFHDENRKKTIDYQQENNYWMSFCDIQNNQGRGGGY